MVLHQQKKDVLELLLLRPFLKDWPLPVIKVSLMPGREFYLGTFSGKRNRNAYLSGALLHSHHLGIKPFQLADYRI